MHSFIKKERRRVITHLGRGEVVHILRNGTIVVELEHGGGHIFYPEEVRDPSGRELTDLLLPSNN